MGGQYAMPVLMYHRIVAQRQDAGRHSIYVLKSNFVRQLDYLKKKSFNTITFKDLAARGELKPRPKEIVLTFDDGYVDNYTIMFPLLKQYGFKAVIFQVTGLGQNDWGIREGEPNIPLLTAAQIKEMQAYGIEFGAHTQTHPDLLKLDTNQRMKEIAGSKADLERILGREVISFAYPFGGINEDIKQQVHNAGYQFGISTKSGPYELRQDLMQIRRIDMTPRTTLFSFKRKVSGFYYTKTFLEYLFSSKSI